MKKILSLSFLLFILCHFATAQTTFQPKQISYENKGVVYNKEFAMDFRLHTNGFALAANIGKIKTYYKTRYFHIEIGELKHAREFRQSKDFPSWGNGRTSRAFILGKQNNFYVLRAGIGFKRYFSEKAKKKGLAIGINYEIGPSIGLIKPYYLELFQETDQFTPGEDVITSVRYTEEVETDFLDFNNIYGASGFSKGLSEVTFAPGGHAKIGVHFDWGAFDEYVKAIEAGVMVDAYIRKIPIMVEGESLRNQPFFINLYLNLHIGKRW